MFGFAIDVQAGGLGPWTVIGTAVARRRLAVRCTAAPRSCARRGGCSSWSSGGRCCSCSAAMTAMIRARFSTPTVGREGMIGEDGTAEVAVDPDGVVLIRGARWRARTNRATPIRPATRCGWWRSRASCSRSSRPRAGRRTTGNAARNRKAKPRNLTVPGRRLRAGPLSARAQPGVGSAAASTPKGEGVRDRQHTRNVAHACRVPGPGDRPVLPALEQRTAEDRDARESRAKAICRQCPVRSECLDHALRRRRDRTGSGAV